MAVALQRLYQPSNPAPVQKSAKVGRRGSEGTGTSSDSSCQYKCSATDIHEERQKEK